MDWGQGLLALIGGLAGATVGSYLKAYWGGKGKTLQQYEDSPTLLAIQRLEAYEKKKGEQQATTEDIERLLVQLKLTTEQTETIKAQIGGDLWRRQALWTLQKESMFTAIGFFTEAKNALIDFSTAKRLGRADIALVNQVRASMLSLITESTKLTTLVDESTRKRLVQSLESLSDFDIDRAEEMLSRLVAFNTEFLQVCRSVLRAP